MFLCVLHVPQIWCYSKHHIYGKENGIFPFITKGQAKRNGKDRRVGTLKIKPINSIIKDVTRRMMVDKVVTLIESIWSGGISSGTIFVQQDNVKPHISVDDPEFVETAKKMNLIYICAFNLLIART